MKAEYDMNENMLEIRIKRHEDIEAIKKLTATYALYVNKGWNGKSVDFDKLPLVFADDARWTSLAAKTDTVGCQEIVLMLKISTARIDFAMHSFTNPIIDVDGDKATANWLLWVAIKTGEVANEVFQSEDLTYTRTSSGWKIQTINLHYGAMLNAPR